MSGQIGMVIGFFVGFSFCIFTFITYKIVTAKSLTLNFNFNLADEFQNQLEPANRNEALKIEDLKNKIVTIQNQDK